MNERISKIFASPLILPISILVAFGAGAGCGYIIGKRKKTYIHAVPEEQMAFDYNAMEEFREEKKRGKDSSDPVKDFVAEKLKEAMTSHDEPEPVVDKNIFAHNDTDWNYDIEMKHRSADAPYVLHKDEFYAEEMEPKGYIQSTLTYYAGDNILVDEDDSPIYNHSNIVGDMLFGHGSGDPNVFYVRNDKNKAEYEILHDDGLYSVEVLGLEIEDNERVKGLKHSGERKFKMTE